MAHSREITKEYIMLKKIIAVAVALGVIAAAGCSSNQAQPPVTSGHYTAHPYHGGKTGGKF